MNPTQLFDPASGTYTYLLFDEHTREAVLIDPVDEQRHTEQLPQRGVERGRLVECHASSQPHRSAAPVQRRSNCCEESALVGPQSPRD